MDENTRPTDYGADVSATEAHAVSTRYDAATGERLKRGARILLIVLVVGFVAVRIERFFHDRVLKQAAREAAAAAIPVDAIVAQPVAALQQFTLPGQTAAWYTSTIYARVSGYVARWFVDIGDRVKQGQVLALIDTPELDAQLVAARAQLERARADVGMRQAEEEFARLQYERWRDSPKGVVSEQERDQKRTEYDSAQAQYKAAQAQVALNQAQVAQYQALTQFKRVTAPFDGVITARDIDIGNLVTAGSTTATTPLYVMTQNDPMRVFVEVPQSAATELMQASIPVTVQTTGTAPRSYSGKVARTSEAINARARTLRVEVDLENKDGGLVPGLYVKASFGLPPKGLVQVPAAALLFRSAGPQVAVIGADDRVRFQPVTIARDDGNMVELGTGVRPGERLALNLSSQVGAGDLVQVAGADAPKAPAVADVHP
ncbi:MAG TPA: efflux RND transporter periplasmic adaptor subunit [Steroidobacteraceae bacterium]|nr:efflux RND transporter periplasmic adaptor subunit [Steroidobacteraceae bacterium]